jgi:toxin HigB-1
MIRSFRHRGAERSGHYAVTVSKNWRLTFRFESGDAVLVDYQDYH